MAVQPGSTRSPSKLRRWALGNRLWQWWRRVQGRPLIERGCGRCGYPVHGLPGATCPECGADRGVVGVVEPVAPLPARIVVAGWVAVWTMLLLMMAWLANDLVSSIMPSDVSNHRDYVMEPRSGTYGPIRLRRIGYGWGWLARPFIPDRPDRGVIEMQPEALGNRYMTHLSFELPSAVGGYAVTEFPPAPHPPTPLPSWQGRIDEAAILKWMQTIGIDTTQNDIRAEAGELLSLMLAPDFSPAHHDHLTHFKTTATGGPQRARPSKGHPLVVFTWLLIWASGCWLISRRVRAEKRPLDGATVPPVGPRE